MNVEQDYIMRMIKEFAMYWEDCYSTRRNPCMNWM